VTDAGTRASPGSSPGPLTTVARRGFVWQALAFGGARLSVLASTIVLARYLGPSDFGFISFAVVLVMAVTIVSDAGVSQALVYLETTRQLVGSALVIAVVSSLGLALLWVLVAPPVAARYGHDDRGLMLATLAAVIVVTAMALVPDAVLRRRLQFARRLPGEIARGVGRGGVAIVLAVLGFGPWALVIGEIAGALAYAVVASAMAYTSGLRAARGTRDDARRLLRFGLPASANGVLATAVSNVDYVVVASVLGTSAVGVYLVGFRIPELVVLSVFQVFSQVAYPVYTRVKDEAPRLRRAYLLSLRLQASYGLAAGATIAATAGTMTAVLFGDAYADSAAVMRAIGLYVVFQSLAVGAVDLFKAIGRPDLAVRIGIARLAVLVPVLLLATRWGITGVAVMQAVVALLFVLVTQQVVIRKLDLRLRDVFLALAPSLLIASGAGGVGWLVDRLVAGDGLVSLVAAVSAAVATAGVLLLLTDRRTVVQAVRG
jgi:lipopolysaccharide exporter